ncbi:PspA/IM30 family protein [Beijerinckia sp. L45]|uniref:PspA/IM30 family protein n=1 Tax=Beijerinckia sp. L45 TaxID=1641855 RepID=UPI00131CBE78|nr:PspA/IM30 family protein [Beijerinckia sp. L45]
MLLNLKSRIADLLLPERSHVRESDRDLDRSLAAAGDAHVMARRALALAVAEEDREAQRRAARAADAADLQERAVAALKSGRVDLAARAADAIAAIETEIAASVAAADRFAENVGRARREVEAQRRRLAELDRGRRLALVGSALAGFTPAADGSDPMTRAEAALVRIEAANADREAVRLAFAPPAATVADDLAEAGLGRPARIRASDVMARLRAIAAPPVSLPEA